MPEIIKADGTREAFRANRLHTSLLRAGAGPYAADRITETITHSIAPGSTSKEIYARAFTLLRKEARPVAARYALRRALLEFGPTGHPFEDFISYLFRKEGWKVETRKMIMGKCVEHETDFFGTRGEERMAAELKYHNDPAYKTDLKTALYVKARFEDIWQCDPKFQTCPIDRGILVTNTKFTSEAVKYAACASVELLGWNYPLENSLFDRLIEAKVYPVSTLTTLSKSEKRLLIDAGVVAADELPNRTDVLRKLHMPAERVGQILAEVDALMNLPHPRETL